MQKTINLWIRYLFPIFLAVFLGVLIFMMGQFREPPGFEWYGLIWFVGSVFILWEVSWWIGAKLDKQLPWRKGAFKRLMVQLLATNLFGLLFFLSTYILLNWYENTFEGKVNPLGMLHVLTAIGKTFFIVQIINSVQIGYQLMQSWQEAQREAEAYKKESLASRLEAVLQQIDPHFFTNNFNELEALIQQSPEKAGTYLRELAENYQASQTNLADSLVNVQQSLEEESASSNKAISNGTLSTKGDFKNRFLVRSGNRFVLVHTEDIVALYKDELVLLYTREGKKYAIDTSLEEILSQLPPQYFFRINRQCIIHSRYLGEMRTEGNQMQVSLRIPFPKTLSVSQRNIGQFKQWLKEG